MVLITLALISALAFWYYGTLCLFAVRARREYRRYGIAHLRVMVGYLQLLGATGVMVGLFVSPIGAAAALGLAIMMTFAIGTRIRIGDTFKLMLPATSQAILNWTLVYLFATA